MRPPGPGPRFLSSESGCPPGFGGAQDGGRPEVVRRGSAPSAPRVTGRSSPSFGGLGRAESKRKYSGPPCSQKISPRAVAPGTSREWQRSFVTDHLSAETPRVFHRSPNTGCPRRPADRDSHRRAAVLAEVGIRKGIEEEEPDSFVEWFIVVSSRHGPRAIGRPCQIGFVEYVVHAAAVGTPGADVDTARRQQPRGDFRDLLSRYGCGVPGE